MKKFSILLVLLAAIPMVMAKPDLPAPKKEASPKVPSVPNLAGQTNWGELTQVGSSFKIDGHPVWFAVGEIRVDGKVNVIWTLRENNEPCPGVYEIRKIDNALVGLWGYSRHEIHIDEEGNLVGSPTYTDTTYKIAQ